MRLEVRACVVAVFAVVVTSGCSSMSRKFTFMRPDLSSPKYERTAPEYKLKPDKRGGSVMAMELLALAQERFKAGRYAEAENQARAALKADPKSADAYVMLGLAADQQQQRQQAGAAYAKAAGLAPTRGVIANNYGAWLCANGRAGDSLAWFDRALADPAYPTPAAARANAGACALDAGQQARAERDLRAALAQEPVNAVALAAMARNEFAVGRYFEARAFSERRLDAAPPTVEILRLASQIEGKLGDNRAAARYLQQIPASSGQPSSGQPSVQQGETGRP